MNTNQTIQAPTKFTKEIKKKWLNALKSGEFKQGIGQLEYNTEAGFRHCCIGVLGCIIEGLNNDSRFGYNGKDSPYQFLIDNVGETSVENLWKTNDGHREPEKKDLGNYLNVIPLIEKLETQD